MKMDSKNQENSLKKYDEKSLEKFQSRVIFTDPAYLFIFKKTEKMVAAIYLITNLISDIEPIKWQVRKSSLRLVSDTLTLKCLASTELKQTVMGLMVTISEINSLLKIASVADHVSSMNCSVIQRELTLLLESLQNISPEVVGKQVPVLSQDFFNVPTSVPMRPLATNFPIADVFSGIVGRNFHKGQYKTSPDVKDNQIQQEPKDNLKDTRRENILNLLKVGKPLGIKDFAREIKGCSEKTIQRELLAMVANGVLKKIGERRWSLYSLA